MVTTFEGSLNKKEIIIDKIRYYEKLTLEQCSYQLNMKEVYTLIGKYSDEIVKFEGLSSEEQQVTYLKYFEKLSYILDRINAYFANEFEKAWKYKLGYRDDEPITIGDIVRYYVFSQKEVSRF